jgi:hypothetical protein
MLCQEISFTDANCRIEIDEDNAHGGQPFTARLSLVDEERAETRPLVFPTGERIVVKGESESAALRAAVGYLESRFGSLCEYGHGCSTDITNDGPPLVVESAAPVDPLVDEASAEAFPASAPPASVATTASVSPSQRKLR